MNDSRVARPYLAGLIATPVRLVVGWLFFSAFWRRVILEPNKLDPHALNYVGHKFNEFMPQALFIGPMLDNLISHPGYLHLFLVLFTVIEALVGLALLLGCCTRIAAFGSAMMSFGILLGAGWLGTTCLDEWQIGSIGLVSGLILTVSGAGPWSVDFLLRPYFDGLFGGNRWYKHWHDLFERPAAIKALTAGASIVGVFWMLLTNQLFFNGIWGKLHNPSAKPHLIVSDARLSGDNLSFEVYRDGGPDSYGSFVVAMTLTDSANRVVAQEPISKAAHVQVKQIQNRKLVKVRTNEFSLVMPLGGKAGVLLNCPQFAQLPAGMYSLTLTDVSGMKWSAPVNCTRGATHV